MENNKKQKDETIKLFMKKTIAYACYIESEHQLKHDR